MCGPVVVGADGRSSILRTVEAAARAPRDPDGASAEAGRRARVVTLTVEITHGIPGDLCAGPGPVVVGAGRRAGAASPLPGPVSRAVPDHAHGPVAAVRSGED